MTSAMGRGLVLFWLERQYVKYVFSRWPECVCCLLPEGKVTGLQVRAAVPFCSGHNKSVSASAGQLCDETKLESNTPKAAIAVHSSRICRRQNSDQARLADARMPVAADRMDSMFGCG